MSTDEVIPLRREVIEARRTRITGPIVLARPVPVKLAGQCACAVLAALGLLLYYGEYTRKVRVSGELEPTAGAIRVVAPQFGQIVASRVRDGQTVKAGQVMYELSGERIGSNGSIDARVADSLDSRRNEVQQRRDVTIRQLAEDGAALAKQQQMAEGEVANHRSAIVIQDAQTRSAADNFKRYEKLARNGYVSQAQLDQYRNALNLEKAKRNALSVNLSSAERALVQVRQEAGATASRAKLARSEAKQALAGLAQEAAEHDGRRAMRITAPASGLATAMGFKPGQSVPAGAALATILPAGSAMEAQLMVPSRVRAFVKPGQQVLLRIDAFPYQKFGMVAGTVDRVERSPLTEAAASGGERMYRVTVALPAQTIDAYGVQEPVEAGMRLEADILQDRRRLIEWLFEPIISAAKGRAQ